MLLSCSQCLVLSSRNVMLVSCSQGLVLSSKNVSILFTMVCVEQRQDRRQLQGVTVLDDGDDGGDDNNDDNSDDSEEDVRR